MPGLVPGIHVFLTSAPQAKTWMAGTSPAMTNERVFDPYSEARYDTSLR
jgi:hypothetical protein